MFTDVAFRWATSSDSTLVYRLTVDEYDRLAAAGVLDNLQVELIDGLLVRKAIQGPPHARAVEVAYHQLDRLLTPGWSIREEKPVRIPRFDVLDPDVSVIRRRRGPSRSRQPVPEVVVLVVEVADGSLEIDRSVRMATYAIGDIPVYWIIKLVARQVEVYSDPRRGQYRTSQVLEPEQEVPIVIDGAEVGRIAVADLLP